MQFNIDTIGLTVSNQKIINEQLIPRGHNLLIPMGTKLLVRSLSMSMNPSKTKLMHARFIVFLVRKMKMPKKLIRISINKVHQ